jgi:hypothetical protein
MHSPAGVRKQCIHMSCIVLHTPVICDIASALDIVNDKGSVDLMKTLYETCTIHIDALLEA